ncbi:CTLH/CRA C-terminal to lish motif domain-containing protein [Irpex rosettiformis]|uniref:CTLH/CRA C-terminal to lish motif domain-containing protein n=1 Tax=Irpex rosettiformis TaxID=378272 RepID=A0ACB8U8U1_9APHY|nr:CTLH/CRA C-terminal to lish motif domain-containing protein [Irpex rosettiformis]
MAATTLNVDGVMLFEQPFARVPYENYRKVFRTSQKNIEKELGAIQTAASELARKARSGAANPEDALRSIDAMMKRAEGLKKKLNDLQTNSGAPTLQVIRERLQHLAAVEDIESVRSPEFARWADTRLDRWLIDWTLRHGREKTARRIAAQKGIGTLVDIELFSDIRRIEDALSRHSCTEALAWCSENKAALRKVKNPLEFELRLQEFIELTRARKLMDAITYQKKYLIQWQESQAVQINQASALLAYTPISAFGPYKRLYDLSRWQTLIQSFRVAIYNLSTLPTEPLLHLAMYAGLASLKLPACYNQETTNIDCPICDPDLGKLATEVPFSHHVNSTIVCRITGKIMDSDNFPMAFPEHGTVYSREALEDMASRNEGQVTCPRTKETCHFADLRKVYIS